MTNKYTAHIYFYFVKEEKQFSVYVQNAATCLHMKNWVAESANDNQ